MFNIFLKNLSDMQSACTIYNKPCSDFLSPIKFNPKPYPILSLSLGLALSSLILSLAKSQELFNSKLYSILSLFNSKPCLIFQFTKKKI